MRRRDFLSGGVGSGVLGLAGFRAAFASDLGVGLNRKSGALGAALHKKRRLSCERRRSGKSASVLADAAELI